MFCFRMIDTFRLRGLTGGFSLLTPRETRVKKSIFKKAGQPKFSSTGNLQAIFRPPDLKPILVMTTFRDPEIENFSKGTNYSVIGIINGQPMKIPIPRFFKCIQRIPFITPESTQCIIEIESKKIETELQFYPNWRDLQLIIFQRIKYWGVTEHVFPNKKVHIFRLNQDNNRFTFVWLSAIKFWINPIKKPDQGTTPEFTLARYGKGEGILNVSSGSQFGAYWEKSPFRDIHSATDLHPYNLSIIESFRDHFNRRLKNIPSGKLRNKRPDQYFLCHK